MIVKVECHHKGTKEIYSVIGKKSKVSDVCGVTKFSNSKTLTGYSKF